MSVAYPPDPRVPLAVLVVAAALVVLAPRAALLLALPGVP